MLGDIYISFIEGRLGVSTLLKSIRSLPQVCLQDRGLSDFLVA